MKTLNIKKVLGLLFLLVSFIGGQPTKAQTTYHVTHNINTGGDLIIPGNSTNNYRIIGNKTNANIISDSTYNRIVIGSGYHGTIMLDYVHLKTHPDSSTAVGYSPISVLGQYNRSNLSPVTKVNIVLRGENTLGVVENRFFPALRVDQGAQIHLCAVDTLDNSSGKLHAYVPRSTPVQGGAAAIGGGYNSNGAHTLGVIPNPWHQGVSTGLLYNSSNNPYTDTQTRPTAVGNIIISSGSIRADGGYHGAGIGSGWYTWFVGNIIIYGGEVVSSGGGHAAGIGTGCPTGSGNAGNYAGNSSIIVLPPAQITATTQQSGRKGLAGAGSITYFGDPESPIVSVFTEDQEPNADIYANVSMIQSVISLFDSLQINKNLSQTKFGTTQYNNMGDSAYVQFRATLLQPIVFFTDHSSTNPAHSGLPYKPKETTIPGTPMAQKVELELFDIGVEFEIFPVTARPLEKGYTSAEAEENSYRVKIIYKDNDPWTNLMFDLQSGVSSNFKNPFFLDKDSVRMYSAPSTLQKGDTIYVVVQLQDNKDFGVYTDILRLTGTWKGISTGYLLLPIEQRVVLDDTETNNHIRVTANPSEFMITETAAGTQKVNLSLWISHADFHPNNIPYAKYLITTEPDYNNALATTPIGQWANLTTPATDGATVTTEVSFAGKPKGKYYIHWFVISGTLSAHSKDVISPPAQYGGFGPYMIADVEDDLATVFEYNSTSIDIFANDPLSDSYISSISSVLNLVTVQPKAGVLSANGKKIIYKHTDAVALTHHVDSFSYRVNVGGTNLDAKVYVYVIKSVNGNLAVCKGSNYSLTLAGTNVAYTWYDINNDPLSTGATFTRNNVQEDIHLGVAPMRTAVPYRNLQFPAAPLTVKVVNPDGLPATMRWTGAIDTCWHNPGNWVQVVGNTEIPVAWLPTSCVNVIIPSDAPNYPMMVADGTCNDIEMQDRAMLAGIDRLTYQNASVEIKLAPSEKDRFVMWSAPLKAMYSGDYHYKTGGTPHWGDVYMNLFQLANPAGGTGAQANRFTATFGELGESLSLGKAFNVRVTSTTANYGNSFVFPQTATSYTDNKGTSYAGLTRTNGRKFIVDRTQVLTGRQFDMPVANDIAGNNLIQVVNPYMAYLDVKKFLDNNPSLGTSYAVWNGNVNESFISVISAPPYGEGNRYIITSPSSILETSGLIPPLQSFFVTKTSTAKVNNVKMSPDWTTTVGAKPYALRSSSDDGERNILRIKASQGEKTSYAVLHNISTASAGYSEEKDMPKLFYDAISLEVYTLSPAGEPLAIYSTGDFGGEVRLGLKLAEEGEVTLDFQNMTGFNHDVLLIDNELKGTDREIDLRKNSAYTFFAKKEKQGTEAIEINDRFSLRFAYNPTGNENIEEETDLQVFQVDDYLHIRSTTGPINSLQILTIDGALVYSATMTSDHFKVQMRRQRMYVVKGSVNGKESVQKILMK